MVVSGLWGGRNFNNACIHIAEVSIESIQRELSSFEGTSDFKRSRGKVIKEEEDTTWEPPLWKQQYENIRKMRSKRDAPVDKYGCFKNAETEVSPEVSQRKLTH